MKRTRSGSAPTSDEALVTGLRHALRHLYEPSALLSCPLLPLLGLPISFEGAVELRQRLTAIIRSLKPEDHVQPHALPWRVYEVLLYRYVQQFSQLEVADQLGVSIRHLRRTERAAMASLAAALRREYGARLAPPPVETSPSPKRANRSSTTSDLSWLADPSANQMTDLTTVLSGVLDLASPLLRERAIRVERPPLTEAITVSVHPVLLRQILLAALTVAARTPGVSHLAADVRPRDRRVEVVFRCEPLAEVAARSTILADFGIVKELAMTGGSRLDAQIVDKRLILTATFPRQEQQLVLLIDDDRAFWTLVERFVSGSPYQIYGVSSIDEALRVAEKAPPAAIMLDVMMPDLDGWDVLERLRRHPVTAKIPVIVCTILPEEELAFSLGASGFLRKPVKRSELLSALNRLIERAEPAFRSAPAHRQEVRG